jgi:hypothetical protein
MPIGMPRRDQVMQCPGKPMSGLTVWGLFPDQRKRFFERVPNPQQGIEEAFYAMPLRAW